MFETFLSYLNVTVVSCAVTFVGTMVFSQKIKDWVRGVPSEVRAKLAAAETAVLAHVKASNAELVNKALVALGTPTAPPAA